MIKKVLIFITSLLIILSSALVYGDEPSYQCQSTILIDADTGTILSSKNPQKKMYPASLTKIMTAILAIEKGDLSDVITVDDETPYEIVGSHIALEPGEKLTFKDLLYATMLPSANDAALAIAKHYGETEEAFVKMMNDKAKELGAMNTHFVNPHGLHNDSHYTTAYDLALITKYALQNETFKTAAGTFKYEIQPTNKKTEPRLFTNLNRLIYSVNNTTINVDGQNISPLYEGADGVKTGYTPEAGYCLVATAKRNGTRLIAVAMNGDSTDMYVDAHKMFDYGFSEYKSINLIDKNTFVQTLTVENGDTKEISVITKDSLSILSTKDSTDKIKSQVIINDFTLPLERNAVIGVMKFTLDGEEVGQVSLITPTPVASVEEEKSSASIPAWLWVIVVPFILIAAFIIYNKIRISIIRKRRKKRKNRAQAQARQY